MNPRNFTATQGARVHCEYPSPQAPNPAAFPAMVWSTNYGRLASQTLFTMFFAGRDFAPRCIIDKVNIQDYLQSHYIAAFGALADRIRDAGDLLDECVIGWDSMNEPDKGFCGCPDLNVNPSAQGSVLKLDSCPTPAQSLRLGMGTAQTVDTWTFGSFGPRQTGTAPIDPQGRKLWAEPETEPNGVHPVWGWRRHAKWVLGTCPWAQHGVWDVQTGKVLRPDYFRSSPSNMGREVVFIEDYWRPHWQAFASRIRKAHPESIMFVAPPVFAAPPSIPATDLQGRCCYSPHYYDGMTLIKRRWHPFNGDALGVVRGNYSSPMLAAKFGENAIRKSIQKQLGIFKEDAAILGPYPTIIGEIGIPFNLDDGRAYGFTNNGKYKGDYSNQQKALDASLNATDGPNALNYTIWTYCPDNSHVWGDGWNLEDLSIWSYDDLRGTKQPTQSAIASLDRWKNAYDFLTDGARAVKAFCRPYPIATVGVPKDIQLDIKTAEFKLVVRVRPEDRPRHQTLTRAGSSSSSSTTLELENLEESEKPEQRTKPEEAEELATEIYVPLVHYATDTVLARARGEQDEKLGPWLALSVRVSEGRWRMEGQTLKWWYPVPADGESEREYTITITRAGGAIGAAEANRRRSLWELLRTYWPSLSLFFAALFCVYALWYRSLAVPMPEFLRI